MGTKAADTMVATTATMNTEDADRFHALFGDRSEAEIMKMPLREVAEVVTERINSRERAKAAKLAEARKQAALDKAQAMGCAIIKQQAEQAFRDGKTKEQVRAQVSYAAKRLSEVLAQAEVSGAARPRTCKEEASKESETKERRATTWPLGKMDAWEKARDLDLQEKMPALREAAEKVIVSWWNEDVSEAPEEEQADGLEEDEPRRIDPSQAMMLLSQIKRVQPLTEANLRKHDEMMSAARR